MAAPRVSSTSRWAWLACSILAAGCVDAGNLANDASVADLRRPANLAMPPADCGNGLLDGDEADVDCGGSCLPCDLGKVCRGQADCASMLCVNGRCAGTSCNDGMKNGDESDVDCGGSCANHCADGQHCNQGADCQGGNCEAGTCSSLSCKDGALSGAETDVDCGGPQCPPCGDGKTCKVGSDCASSTCSGNVCAPRPTCVDKVQNGAETDVDCGGTCPQCKLGRRCGQAADCVTGRCANATCIPAQPLVLSLAAPVHYPVGKSPFMMVLRDVNRDQRLDVLTVGQEAKTVSVLLGRGDGTLEGAVDYATDPYPGGVAVADFDRDGKLDLAVACAGGGGPRGTVTFLKGDGNGQFQPAGSFDGGTCTTAVAAGDFNHDGFPDVAVANACNMEGVTVMLGKGNFTFQAAILFPAGTHPANLTAGDLNGDGRDDLAVANLLGDNVSILVAMPNGAFPAPINYAVGQLPQQIVLRDLNGDGKPEVVVANQFAKISVLVNKGMGAFAAAANYTGFGDPFAVAVADLDLDGFVDAAFADGGSAFIGVMPGSGPAMLDAARMINAQFKASYIAAGDLDGDGKPDLVTAHNWDSKVGVFLNTSK